MPRRCARGEHPAGDGGVARVGIARDLGLQLGGERGRAAVSAPLALAELDPAAKPRPEPCLPPASPAEVLPSATSESLDGKCVLCVGGRSGAVGAYREAVERQGGRFLHHDGGLEESLHRIDSALAAADLVICQAGCISHNAYWRVKEQCKRTGKPCLFVKRSGVSSFGRVIADLCGEEPEAVSAD